MTDTKMGLLQAMLAVQRDAPTLPKDKINPHYKSKYTPLDTIVETIGPLLVTNGLVWSTLPCSDEQGAPALRYRLAHADTGEVLEGTMPLLLSREDAQGMGTAITYARRYSLCAVLNLVADDDDDGSAAVDRRTSGPSRSAHKPTDKQVDYLAKLIKKAEPKAATMEALLRGVGAGSVKLSDNWANRVDELVEKFVTTSTQASTLIETFKNGVLPDPSMPSDIPADTSDFEAPPIPDGMGGLPFSETDDTSVMGGAQGAEHES